MGICAGRPDSIGTGSARQSLSARETYGRSAKDSPPESFARQSPPCPLLAQRRSDKARSRPADFRNPFNREQHTRFVIRSHERHHGGLIRDGGFQVGQIQ